MKRIVLIFSQMMCGAAVVAGMSSCRMMTNSQGVAQWEIRSEVPASLDTGVPSSAPGGLFAGGGVRSDLSGDLPGLYDEGALLDLPSSDAPFDELIDIPKPDPGAGGLAYQSPPEMLSIPEGNMLPLDGYRSGSGGAAQLLLPSPPAELPVQDAIMTPAKSDSAPTTGPDQDLPAPQEVAPARPGAGIPTLPLLYGQLDLGKFLGVSRHSPAPPAGGNPQNPDDGIF